MKKELITNKTIKIGGDSNIIHVKQYLELNDFVLDTLKKRLKWLFTGKVGT